MILIDKDQHKQQQVVTEMHELLHSLIYEYEIAGWIPDQQCEEKIVSILTIGLMNALRDNPKWTKRLINAL